MVSKQLAFDIAQNYVSSGWNTGSNLGSGYQPWIFNMIQGSGFAGAFIGDPSGAGITGLGTNAFAFGLYANPPGSGASATVTRPFATPWNIGDVFTIDFGLNWDSNDPNSFRGFEFLNNSTPVLEVYGSNNDDIFINNNLSVDTPMFLQYGTQAMRLYFTLKSSNSINVFGIGRNGNEIFNQDIPLSAIPNAISFYFEETIDGSQPQRQMYFDRLNFFRPWYLWAVPGESGESRHRRLRLLGYI